MAQYEQYVVTKGKQICLTRDNNSGLATNFNRIVRKNLHIDCHSLPSMRRDEFDKLRVKCVDANITLSMDICTSKPCAVDLCSYTNIGSVAYYFHGLTALLDGCSSVTMPYF